MNNAPPLLKNRVFWVMALFVSLFILIALFTLSLCWKDRVSEQRLMRTDLNLGADKTPRANIVDRNGIVLASDIALASVYANTKFILGTRRIAHQIHSLFPDLNETQLIHKLNSKKAFVWIKRNLTPAQEKQVYELGIPGLGFLQEFRRVYPNQQLVSHILGSVDIDNKGIAGLEYYLDTTQHLTGTPVQTTLDIRAQYILYDELENGMKKFHAIGAAGLLMNAQTGEIIALVSIPSFDPNTYAKAGEGQKFNRVTLGTYEMGSVMKVFTLACALDAGAVHLGQKFDVSEPIHFGRFTIHDYHSVHKPLTVEEIFTQSSNIGVARIAMHMGGNTFVHYLKKLGILDSPRLEIPEIGHPLVPKKWSQITLVTVSFGHGLSLSPLQTTLAFASIVNGGKKVEPTLLKRPENIPLQQTRIFREETSLKVQRLLRRVVTEGTGKKANVNSYSIIGKTGTAEKIQNGHYVKKGKNLSSFLSAFPAEKPRYVMLVMFDEPKATPETFGFTTAGWNAAPVSADIIKRVAPILGIFPTPSTGIQPQDEKPV